MTPSLDLTIDGGIAKLMLNNPSRLNAFTPEMLTQLESHCATLEREANALGHRLLQDHVAREKQYDQRTRHGATQGARLD